MAAVAPERSATSVLSSHSSDSRKRQKKGQETWRWVCRYNELDDRSEDERKYARYGVVRGMIKDHGEVVKIDLHGCKLQGELPSTMLAMVSLRVLILFKNELSGIIPEEIGDLPNLEHLDLSHNALTGGLPASLERLIKLRQLHVEHNQLSGPLPPVFTNLTQLRRFTANNNYFSGPIPDLSECSLLEELHLHENLLDGEIPEKLAQCKRLGSLFLARNCLQGAVPESITSGCSFHFTPRSGVGLPCQAMPQRTAEEVQQLYGSSQDGYYDDQGRWIQGYYDEAGGYVQGYYDEAGQWFTVSYMTAEEAAAYYTATPAGTA